jgi:hypothetical protein
MGVGERIDAAWIRYGQRIATEPVPPSGMTASSTRERFGRALQAAVRAEGVFLSWPVASGFVVVLALMGLALALGDIPIRLPRE